MIINWWKYCNQQIKAFRWCVGKMNTTPHLLTTISIECLSNVFLTLIINFFYSV